MLTAPFDNIKSLKYTAQLTNTSLATINQMFGSSSQPLTTTDSALIKLLNTVQTKNSARQYLEAGGSRQTFD